jgi:glutathione S-transferase
LNEWCFFIMTELDALGLYVIRRHSDLSAEYGLAPNAVAAAKAGFADLATRIFTAFPRKYLMPEGMSVADILLATCTEAATARGIAVPAFMARHREAMRDRPAYRRAFARNFPDRR